MNDLPVLVIGAGPQGLAAAAHLLERGLRPLVVEAGAGPAHAVSQWGHVRLFSAWPELVDPAAARLLGATGWAAPTRGYPTGSEWISSYLAPLAAALGERVRLGTRVTGVSRRGRDRLVDSDRAAQPFTVHVLDAAGVESRVDARAVIDASGSWTQPNPLGAGSVPALGEHAAADTISYRVPDFTEVEDLAGRHTVIVGSGHSALTALIGLAGLAGLAEVNAGTRISWVLRRGSVASSFGGGDADELPARGALGVRARRAVESGLINVVTGFRVERITRGDAGVVLVAQDGRALPVADRVIALTGFRPDLSFLSEMRLELDTTLQAPIRLAPLIDPNLHSCGSVYPHGAGELSHPEPGLYLVGMKSYGRAPTFLAMTGYEQVRSVAAQLVGDHEAAARVELTLPETGVCGGAGLFDEAESQAEAAGGGCCAPAAPAPVALSGLRVGV